MLVDAMPKRKRYVGWIRHSWRDWKDMIHAESEQKAQEFLNKHVPNQDKNGVPITKLVLPEGEHPGYQKK